MSHVYNAYQSETGEEITERLEFNDDGTVRPFVMCCGELIAEWDPKPNEEAAVACFDENYLSED